MLYIYKKPGRIAASGIILAQAVLLAACGGGGSSDIDPVSDAATYSATGANTEVASTSSNLGAEMDDKAMWDAPNANAGWENPVESATWETTISAAAANEPNAAAPAAAAAEPTTVGLVPEAQQTILAAGTTYSTGTTINASSCSFSAVQSAVNNATAGSTVKIPAGDCSWGASQLLVPAGIHLQGAGKTATIIRRTSHVSNSVYVVKFDCTNGRQAKLSDMTLVGRGNSATQDKGVGLLNGCIDFKVYNSKFTKFVFGAIEVRGKIAQRGVIYNNEFIDNYNSTLRNLGYGVVVYGDATWPALELGTRNAVFVENNYMSGNRHHIASNNSSRYVFRYNTAIANDLTKDYPLVDAHGPSYGSTRGSRSYEIYNNAFSAKLSSGRLYAAAGIRGGDGVIFKNTFTSNIAYPVVLSLEGGTCGSYPVQDQIRQAWIYNDGANPITNKCPSTIRLGRDYFTVAKTGYVPYTYPHPLRGQP